MSNLEGDPAAVVLECPAPDGFELLEPRLVPLGGPRAMEVRRTLPQRRRSLIGAWCFLDHYGPEPKRMVVPPHPHTGLATVSWLFAGEIEHRDSTGAHAMVRPGELNLMTAGHGIQHSEVSTERSDVLHGAQLWLALPETQREHPPFFERFIPEPTVVDDATVHVFIGRLAGRESTATVFSPLVGAQIDLPAGGRVRLAVDPAFEHGVLADRAAVRMSGHDVPADHLGYLPPGDDVLELEAVDGPARLVLIGGEPFGERIVMWWNFVGRTHDEVVESRARWQAEVIAGETDEGRFGAIPGFDGASLPAPELPNVRLSPRG